MKILAIGAHFDDVELGCGGSLLKWKKEGHKLAIFVASKSGYKAPDGKIIRSNEEAYSEGLLSAEKLGAKLYCGEQETFFLEFDEKLNSTIIQIISDFMPDMILTHWNSDSHHDHRSLSHSSIHSARNVKKILMYRSNYYPGTAVFNPQYFVDISNYMDSKMELLKIFNSEFARNKGGWEKYINTVAGHYGCIAGCDYAESFQVIKWVE